jgi:hypothetical protein
LTALCAAAIAACGAVSTPGIALDLANPNQPAVVVTGLSHSDVAALTRANLTPESWTAVLRVAVAADAVPVAGTYAIAGGTVRFTPMFPFDPGRPYTAVFDPSAVPDGALRHLPGVSRVVSTPAAAASPATTITDVYPSADIVPANLLRMYVAFSGPMGNRGGQDYVTIADARRQEISGALLPLDTGLWNPERTRFTILFDPGRVKRGILPNRRMGRPLEPGATFTFAVRAGWPDARGVPLASRFEHAYRVGPAIERGLDPRAWTIAPPAAGSREPLVVDFPWALDHALLERALSIARGGAHLSGDSIVPRGERQWRFTPRDPWLPGAHELVALPELEDVAGNRIGHPFEARPSEADDARAAPARVRFNVGPAGPEGD